MGGQAWMAVGLACAVGAGAAAQSGSATDNKTIVVTGCVQNFSTRSSTGKTERGFILAISYARGAALTPAKPESTDASTSTGGGAPTSSGTPAPTGTTGSATGPSALTAHSYRLIGSEDELKDDVSKRVEVTGTVAPPQPDTASGSSSSSPAAVPGTIPASAQRLQVASIRVVASECNAR